MRLQDKSVGGDRSSGGGGGGRQSCAGASRGANGASGGANAASREARGGSSGGRRVRSSTNAAPRGLAAPSARLGHAGGQHVVGQLAGHSAVHRASAGVLVPANALCSGAMCFSADARAHSTAHIGAARCISATCCTAGNGACFGMSPWGGSDTSTAPSTSRAPHSVCDTSIAPSPALLPSPLYSTPQCLGAVGTYYRASTAGKPRTRGQQGRHDHSGMVRTAAARVIASAPIAHELQHAPPMSQTPYRGRGHSASGQKTLAASHRLKALHDAQNFVLSSLGIDRETEHALVMDAGGLEPHAYWNVDRAAHGSSVPGATGAAGTADVMHDATARANWRDAVLDAQRRRDEALDALLASHKKSAPWR